MLSQVNFITRDVAMNGAALTRTSGRIHDSLNRLANKHEQGAFRELQKLVGTQEQIEKKLETTTKKAEVPGRRCGEALQATQIKKATDSVFWRPLNSSLS